jgi:hypothetical protein
LIFQFIKNKIFFFNRCSICPFPEQKKIYIPKTRAHFFTMKKLFVVVVVPPTHLFPPHEIKTRKSYPYLTGNLWKRTFLPIFTSSQHLCLFHILPISIHCLTNLIQCSTKNKPFIVRIAMELKWKEVFSYRKFQHVSTRCGFTKL